MDQHEQIASAEETGERMANALVREHRNVAHAEHYFGDRARRFREIEAELAKTGRKDLVDAARRAAQDVLGSDHPDLAGAKRGPGRPAGEKRGTGSTPAA